MHPVIARRIVYPVLQWKSAGRVQHYLRQLEASQWAPAEELRELQARRLQALLEHAYRRVPYYRRIFAEGGLHPRHLRGPDDLRLLPTLSKETLRDQPGSLRAEGARGPFVERRTSGSTGIPVVVSVHHHTRDAWTAAALRGLRWWGIDVGIRQIKLINPHGKSPWTLRKQYWLMNHGEYSVFRLDEGALERLYRQVLRSRCEVLFGFPSALTHFAQYVAARGGGRRLRLKAVSSTAELLYPDQRALLHRVFDCPVIDEYGSSETGFLAGGAPAGSRHITTENALIEFAPLEGAPGLAELIVTDLTNLAMPLIRYRIGDLGTAGPPCPCGRRLPVLHLGVGRTEDLVTLPDGRKTDGSVFGVAVERLVARGVPVKQFRAVQHRADDIEILIATDQPGHPALADLSPEIQHHLGAAVSVRVRAVDRIPVEPTGKLRRFISFVGSDRPGEPARAGEPAASSS